MEEETKVIDSAQKGDETHVEGVDVFHVKDFLEITQPDARETERMEFITRYLGEQGAKDASAVRTKLQMIEQMMGAPNLGESRLSRLYNYLKCDAEIEKLVRERNSYLRR